MRTVLTALVALFCLGCQQNPKLQMPPTAEMIAAATAVRCKGVGSGGNQVDCTIDVDIIETDRTCTVRVPPDQDDVAFERRAGRRLILWQIRANPGGYKFTEDGIAFKRGVDPLGNFTDRGTGPLGQVYHWRNRNSAFDVGSYPYTVKVENAAKNITCWWDPRIIN